MSKVKLRRTKGHLTTWNASIDGHLFGIVEETTGGFESFDCGGVSLGVVYTMDAAKKLIEANYLEAA